MNRLFNFSRKKHCITKKANSCGKYISSFMVVTLVVLLFSTPAYAKGSTSSAMKISNVQGVVATQTMDLKNKAAVKNMTLPDAVRIASGEKSYCWIKLDNSKQVKLDSLSDVTLIRNGKTYDVYINSGNVFFDISKKLKANETLRFHSGGLITNVTGTSGFISVDENGNTSITILEGKTEVSYPKLQSSASISNGQTANAVVSTASIATVAVSSGYALNVNKATLNSSATLVPVQINSSSIPGFAAVEIKNNTSLQNKIKNANTLVDVTLIKNQADNILVVNETAKAQSIEKKRQEKIEIERRAQEEREKKERSNNSSGREVSDSHEHSFEHRYEEISKVTPGESYSYDEYKDYDIFVWVRCTKCSGAYQHAIRINEIRIGDTQTFTRDESKNFKCDGVTKSVSDIFNAIETAPEGTSISATAYCKACRTNINIPLEHLPAVLEMVGPESTPTPTPTPTPE